jgi:hypothetical protein
MRLKFLFALIVITLQISCSVPPLIVPTKALGTIADDPVYKNRENRSKSAILQSDKLHPPIGKIILVRSGTTICAIQFKESQLLQERQSPKSEPIISRLYNWSIVASNSEKTGIVTLDSGNDIVRLGPNASMHLTPGIDYTKSKISCGGRFEINGDIGGWVTAFPYTQKQRAYEFSATPWEKVTDIIPTHTKLQWYKFPLEADTFIIIDLDF